MSSINTEALWHQFSARLRSFLIQRVSDAATADDLLQECFLRIHQKLDTIQDESRLVPWIFQIARNLVADHFRKAYRQNPSEILTPPPEDDSSENFNREFSQSLKRFLPAVPELYREVIELYEWHGLTQKEIADRLGLSLTATKSRLQRGRHHLKKLLQDCCHLEQDRYGNIIDFRKREDYDCQDCDN